MELKVLQALKFSSKSNERVMFQLINTIEKLSFKIKPFRDVSIEESGIFYVNTGTLVS